MVRALSIFTRLFVVWVILGGVLGFVYPPALLWVLKGPLVTILLALIMLGMGITLRPEDFLRVLRMPYQVGLGVALQYTLMPLAGFLIGRLFHLDTPFAVGLVLVSCCPGGTASNLIAFLSRANLGLSVSMTAISTILAALFTPGLTYFLVGSRADVNVLSLFLETLLVVVLPICAGLTLNRYLPDRIRDAILPMAPPVAVIAIVLIVGAVLGARREVIAENAMLLVPAVVIVHLIGFVTGYVLARFFLPELSARTIGIEVGMQNSGLGVNLAQNSFAQLPNADVPSAISAVTHCILGSILATVWRYRPPSATGDSEET